MQVISTNARDCNALPESVVSSAAVTDATDDSVAKFSSLVRTRDKWASTRENLFGALRTTKTQTSLRICAVWSAPLLFAYCKVSYIDLLHAKFQFSS